MSNYMVVFIVDALRKFDPALEIGDRRITYIAELSADGKEQLKREIGEGQSCIGVGAVLIHI